MDATEQNADGETGPSGYSCSGARVASQSWFGEVPGVPPRRGNGSASPGSEGSRRRGCWPRQPVPEASASARSSSARRGERPDASGYRPILIRPRQSWSAASALATSLPDARCCTRHCAASTTGRGSGCVPHRTWPTESAACCHCARAHDARSKHAQRVWRWCSAPSRWLLGACCRLSTTSARHVDGSRVPRPVRSVCRRKGKGRGFPAEDLARCGARKLARVRAYVARGMGASGIIALGAIWPASSAMAGCDWLCRSYWATVGPAQSDLLRHRSNSPSQSRTKGRKRWLTVSRQCRHEGSRRPISPFGAARMSR